MSLQPAEPQDISTLSNSSSQDCGKPEIQTSENRKSRLRKISSQECEKTAASYTEMNQTDFSYINPSINLSYPAQSGKWIDRCDCFKGEKAQIKLKENTVGPVGEAIEILREVRALSKNDDTDIVVCPITQPQVSAGCCYCN